MRLPSFETPVIGVQCESAHAEAFAFALQWLWRGRLRHSRMAISAHPARATSSPRSNGNDAKARFVAGCAVNACFLIDLIPFNGTTG
jgi:hypothetical protein